MTDIAQSRTKPVPVGIDVEWTTIGGEDVQPVVEQAEASCKFLRVNVNVNLVLTVVVVDVDGPILAGWYMRPLFVYEELVDILVQVVDVAVTSDCVANSAAKVAELRGRLNEAVDVEEAYDYPEREEIDERASLGRSFARVKKAVAKVDGVVGRRNRVAKRWQSGVDRQAEVGRVRKLQREALKRLYVGGEQPQQPRSEVEVIVIDDEEDENDDEDQDEETSGDDDYDSLAEESDEEMYGVDDDPDGQLDTL
jgi:hypothetical protein